MDLERILQHVTDESLLVARDLQRLAVRQLALESHQFAIAVSESQQLAGLEAVELAAQLRQTAQRRKVGEVQLEATKQLIHGVVAVDHHFDGREGNICLLGIGVTGRLTAGVGWALEICACTSASRGTLARAPTMSSRPTCRIQALRVDRPGTADLMKIGTIYTT